MRQAAAVGACSGLEERARGVASGLARLHRALEPARFPVSASRCVRPVPARRDRREPGRFHGPAASWRLAPNKASSSKAPIVASPKGNPLRRSARGQSIAQFPRACPVGASARHSPRRRRRERRRCAILGAGRRSSPAAPAGSAAPPASSQLSPRAGSFALAVGERPCKRSTAASNCASSAGSGGT